MPKQVEQVQLKPETINLKATMTRSYLTAGITAAKLGSTQEALNLLAQAHAYIVLIEEELVDNPAKG